MELVYIEGGLYDGQLCEALENLVDLNLSKRDALGDKIEEEKYLRTERVFIQDNHEYPIFSLDK